MQHFAKYMTSYFMAGCLVHTYEKTSRQREVSFALHSSQVNLLGFCAETAAVIAEAGACPADLLHSAQGHQQEALRRERAAPTSHGGELLYRAHCMQCRMFFHHS